MIKRSGFSLIEMLLAVWLLGIFTLIASRVLEANFHVTHKTMLINGDTARFDRAITALRTDVNNSASFDMPSPTILRIHGPGVQTIDWQCDHNSISRQLASTRQQWEVDRPLTLTMDGAIVVLTDATDQIAMAPLHATGKP